MGLLSLIDRKHAYNESLRGLSTAFERPSVDYLDSNLHSGSDKNLTILTFDGRKMHRYSSSLDIAQASDISELLQLT